MKTKYLCCLCLVLFLTISVVAQNETPEEKPKPKAASVMPSRDLIVQTVESSSEVVGDEFVIREFAILLLQNSKVNWDAFKNPENFLPCRVGQIAIQERGIPLDQRFKDYNLFVVTIPLSLPEQPHGKYQTPPIPIEYSVMGFVEGEQTVKGQFKKKKVLLKPIVVSKIPLRAFLEADRKSLEIGDHYNLTLSIIFDPASQVLNLRHQDVNSDQKKENFLDNSFFSGQEVLNLDIVEFQPSSYRSMAVVRYRLTTFELPPKLLKVGPLNIVYRLKDKDVAQVYTTAEVYVQLNSVLTKYSVLEGTRAVHFTDSKHRFWLITAPYYAALSLFLALGMIVTFKVVGFLYSLRYKHKVQEMLPIQRIMTANSHVPNFLWHWLCLGYLQIFKADISENIASWSRHIKLCVGSVYGYSTGRALALTGPELQLIDYPFGTALLNIEDRLVNNDTSTKLLAGGLVKVEYFALPVAKICRALARKLVWLKKKAANFGRRLVTHRSK